LRRTIRNAGEGRMAGGRPVWPATACAYGLTGRGWRAGMRDRRGVNQNGTRTLKRRAAARVGGGKARFRLARNRMKGRNGKPIKGWEG